MKTFGELFKMFLNLCREEETCTDQPRLLEIDMQKKNIILYYQLGGTLANKSEEEADAIKEMEAEYERDFLYGENYGR